MATTQTQTVEISAQDARALRYADAICFDHLEDGSGRIRAIRNADHSDTGFEETRIIPAEASRVQDYGKGAHDRGYTAFAMIMYAKHDASAQTLIRRLRAGARFHLVWTRDNSSPVTKEAGLVRDELRLHVQAKNAKVADVLLVQVSVGKDNSARMVKRA